MTKSPYWPSHKSACGPESSSNGRFFSMENDAIPCDSPPAYYASKIVRIFTGMNMSLWSECREMHRRLMIQGAPYASMTGPLSEVEQCGSYPHCGWHSGLLRLGPRKKTLFPTGIVTSHEISKYMTYKGYTN